MNVHISRPAVSTTLSAEGLPRRRWSVADIIRMQDVGIIDRRERFELIGGEIVPMASKGAAHETVKKELTKHWARALPAGMDMLTETTLYISEHDFLEPDFIFWPQSIAVKHIRPADLLLVVEAADSSLSYDLGRKAAIYASLGIPDYWAIDAVRMVTHIHRFDGGRESYAAPILLQHTEVLTPLHLPELAVRLADLGLEPLAE